jgi:hypothetical protein
MLDGLGDDALVAFAQYVCVCVCVYLLGIVFSS